MNIKEALEALDPSNDKHWTGDGMPRMDVLQKLTQTPELSRTEVTNAAPDFSRASVLEAEKPEAPTEDSKVEASPESDETAEAAAEVTGGSDEVQAGGEFDVPAGDENDVMVEAEQPDVVAFAAVPGETVVVTPAVPEIAPTAPETAAPAPTTKLEALQAALAVHTEAMNTANAVKEDADKALKASSDQVNALNRQIDTVVQADPHAATAGIRDYIAMQNKLRVDRAMRAHRFMGTTGAKPGDVAKVLEVRSPLDKAFAGRKAPRGSVRPTVRAVQD